MTRTFLVLTAALALFTSATASEPAARRDLDRAYSQWREAMITRNLRAWQEATSNSRQVSTRNLIVSQKQPFPAALFDLPMRPPETAVLRFLKIDTKGDTAHMFYFGKVDVGVTEASEVPENLLILRFIRETNGWKFDATKLINLSSSPEVRNALKNGGGTQFLDEPGLAANGIVPPTARLCPMPDRIGVLQVASFGYETAASVNTFSVATVQNDAEEHIIIGGLKDGENPLALTVKSVPIPEGATRHLEVNALVLTGSEKKPTIQVFSWKPETHPVAEQVNMIIHVSRITLRD